MADNNNLKYEQINWGWLNDYAGYKFAPITFFDNLYTQDGKIFKTEYENTLDDLRTGKFVVGNAKALAVVNEDGTVSRINTPTTKPVYFNDGKPVECTSIDITSVKANTIEGTTFTGGSFSGNAVTATGKIKGGSLEITGAASVGGTMTITGATTIGGATTINGKLTVQTLELTSDTAISSWSTPTKILTLDGKIFKYSTLTNVVTTNAIDGDMSFDHNSSTNTYREINFKSGTTKVSGVWSQYEPSLTSHSAHLGVYSPINNNDWLSLKITWNSENRYMRPVITENGVEKVGKNSGVKIYGAVWNDYAEYRDQWEDIEPGYCVCSSDNGKVFKTMEKFAPCDGIVSDTFGFAIGDNDTCRTPLAVAGRVLAYCEGDRNNYHAGDTVCAGPDGKVIKMTREEIREYPDRIVGVVSEIPQYEIWENDIKVNGRIWVNVK